MPVWERKICICNREFLWNQFWTREKNVMCSFFIYFSFHLSSAINQIHTLSAYATFLSRITKCYTNNDSWRFTAIGELGKYLCKSHTDWQTESQRSGISKKNSTKFQCIFFLAYSAEKLTTSVFQMCWVCIQIQRSQWKLDYKSSKWGDSSNWPCFHVENFKFWLHSCSSKEDKSIAWATANETSWDDAWKGLKG